QLPELEQEDYDFNTLPAFNLQTLPETLFPLKSNLRKNHIELLGNLVSHEPRQRYSMEYLLHFFLQVNIAIKESLNQNILIKYFFGNKNEDPMEKDFHVLATEKVNSTPVSERMILQSLLQHKKKFKNTNSTGIKDIFKKIKENGNLQQALNTLENIGEERTEPPSFFAS